MPSGGFTYEVLAKFDERKGHRPITVFGTSANTAAFEGERYRQRQRERSRKRAERQSLSVSISSLS
jgi:hypothetical protein